MMKLNGQNRVERFRGIAKELVSKIVENRGVAGIVFAGGLERGFTDKYSDVDILVFLRKKSQLLRNRILKLGSEMQKHSGLDVDLEIYFLDDCRKRKVSEIHKWDLSHMLVAFDPRSEIKQLLSQKTKVPRSYWVRRVVVHSEHLKWYCCPPETRIGTITEAWVKRGDLVSAHYCTDYSLDLIIRVLFALNREFLPPPKWRIFYSYGLKWLPKKYRKLLKEAMMTHELSLPELKRRLSALRELWRGILPRIEKETGLTPSSISRYYIQRILHQR